MKRRLQAAMTSVAERLVLGVFASAPSHVFGIGDFRFDGHKFCARVRPIAEGLGRRPPASTPPIDARFGFLHDGTFLENIWIAHALGCNPACGFSQNKSRSACFLLTCRAKRGLLAAMTTEKDLTTRRQFLKTSALAAIALPPLAGAQETSPPAPRKRKIKKGLMFGAVGSASSVLEKFKLIQQAGFDGVEVDSGMNREQVLQGRDATGLIIASVVDSVHWQDTLADPSPEVRQRGLEGLTKALHDCKAYGATSVLLVPAVVNKTVSYDEAYTRSAAEIRKVTALAEQLGVKIAIENVWNQFLLSPLEAARYVDEFHSPALAWHFDVGNVINFGWPEQWIHILGTRIHKLHIKEYSRKKRDQEGLWKGFAVEYLEGDNDWPAVMKALDEIGYQGWGTAEPAYSPPGVDLPTRLGQISHKLDEIFAL
jgi:hexulose-6-phosphate isomerase